MATKLSNLTPRQADTLAAINKLSKKGYPPTLHEIRVEMGLESTNSVRTHLDELERKGSISRAANLARSIRVLE